MLLDVDEITVMQQAAVARWHEHGIDNPYSGFLRVACHQCSLNYLLWHQEDVARSPVAEDAEIALVKRTIDQLNQQRNDCVELMDSWIADALERLGHAAPDAPLNTETPGSVIDRLAILTLRIYHLREQIGRRDATAGHRESVHRKLAICTEQRQDLATSLEQLLRDLRLGRRRHKVYRQFKMYNDPTLNPYLYQSRGPAIAARSAMATTGLSLQDR